MRFQEITLLAAISSSDIAVPKVGAYWKNIAGLDEARGRCEPLTTEEEESYTNSQEQPTNPYVFCMLIVVKITIIAALIICIIVLTCNIAATRHLLVSVEHLCSSLGVFAPVVMIPVYSVLISLFFPGEVLVLLTSYLFKDLYGYKWGFVLTVGVIFISLVMSCSLSFVVCRTLLFKPTQVVCRHFPLFRAFARGVKDGGCGFVTLLRFSPMFPFALTSAVLAVTEIGFRDTVLATIGVLPMLVVTVYVGSHIKKITDVTHAWKWDTMHVLLLVSGVAIFALAFSYITLLTKRHLARIAVEDEVDPFLRSSNAFYQLSPKLTTTEGIATYQQILGLMDHGVDDVD